MIQYLDMFLDILTAIFAILGGLKVIARYTRWKWDDRVLEILERPIRLILSIFGRVDRNE